MTDNRTFHVLATTASDQGEDVGARIHHGRIQVTGEDDSPCRPIRDLLWLDAFTNGPWIPSAVYSVTVSREFDAITYWRDE